jgi:hypothetical protein
VDIVSVLRNNGGSDVRPSYPPRPRPRNPVPGGSAESPSSRSAVVRRLEFAAVAGSSLLAQEKKYEPSVGQAGKDVIWVPTPQALVEKMLDLANVTPRDFVIDLGSGDGRTVIAAAKRGARALGSNGTRTWWTCRIVWRGKPCR